VQQSAIVSIGSKSASASKEQKPASKAGTTSQAPAAEAAARSEAPAVSQHVSSAKPIAEKPSVAAPVKEQVKSTAKPQPEAQKQPDTKPAYCIVLASQTTQRLAQDYVGRLKKDGHQSARVMGMQNSTKVRVVYGSYPSAQAAHNALSSLRASSSHFSEAWVLKL
jgi:cell division protein FtsN